MSSYFDLSILNNPVNFAKDYAYVGKEGVCSIKERGISFPFSLWQNPDLHKTYKKLVYIGGELPEFKEEIKDLNRSQLKNISDYISGVSDKVQKSKAPSLLFYIAFEVYNLFAQVFCLRKIEVFDYNKKGERESVAALKDCVEELLRPNLVDELRRNKTFMKANSLNDVATTPVPPVATTNVVTKPVPHVANEATTKQPRRFSQRSHVNLIEISREPLPPVNFIKNG